MNRQEAKQLADKHSFKEVGTTGRYLIPRRVVHIIIDSLNEDFEKLKKENTRLKKQLASNHHIECSCSFCKPVDNQLKEDLEDYNKMVKVGINAK